MIDGAKGAAGGNAYGTAGEAGICAITYLVATQKGRLE